MVIYYNEIEGKGANLNTTISISSIEMWNITSDTTEYIWYTLNNMLLNNTNNYKYTLSFPNSSTIQYVYIYDITNHYSLDYGWINNVFKWEYNNKLKYKYYNISILIASFGINNGGYAFQTYTKGIIGDVLLNNKNININGWISEGKLHGEYQNIYKSNNTNNVIWKNNTQNGSNIPLTWWRLSFKTPDNIIPGVFTSIAIDMTSVIKIYELL